MSAPLKRPSEEDDNFQEETWEESQVLDEENDNQGPRQQEVIEAQDMSQVPVTESAISTTGATAPARRSKKQRRGKNSPEPNYSEMVQDQMSTTNRTGQACDRCKGRKMKCDSNSTGCANCIAGNLPCTQTDPITRVSYTRGELERLRADNERLTSENEILRAENASLRDYINNVLNAPALEGSSSQTPSMGMGTQSQYTSYEALQAAQAQAQAQAQAIHQAAQQPGQGFPVLYPQSRRQSAASGLPTMQNQTQFRSITRPSQFPLYHTSMATNPYAGRGSMPTPHQQVNPEAYRHGPQQQGAQQGHGQSQIQGQGESQQSGVQQRDNGPSQDSSDNFNYFPDI
ncbi:hypothetical protein MferCBS31731_001268 [Microsporum ferrugineum]